MLRKDIHRDSNPMCFAISEAPLSLCNAKSVHYKKAENRGGKKSRTPKSAKDVHAAMVTIPRSWRKSGRKIFFRK